MNYREATEYLRGYKAGERKVTRPAWPLFNGEKMFMMLALDGEFASPKCHGIYTTSKDLYMHTGYPHPNDLKAKDWEPFTLNKEITGNMFELA